MRQERSGEVSSFESGSTPLRKAQEAPAAAAAPQDEMRDNRQAAEEAAPSHEEFRLTPEAWLAEIARLRAAGETEAADRELVRFNKAYPDYYEKLQPVDPAPQRR
jgi:hypothetical protein